MNATAAVVTQNLTKKFRGNSLSSFIRRRSVCALDNLNIEIQRGEVFGYLGPNGAGKTTTFKLLLGLIFPTSGKAWVLGKSIREVHFKMDVGFLPEQPYFYDYLTGEEFLDFYAQLFRFDKKTRKRKVADMLRMVGLEESADLQLRKFSRGMLQRIGIAQALINDPELVILDEPLSGLDPIGRKEIRDIIMNLKDQGRTILFSSHILTDVEAVCDRIGILMNGRLQRVDNISNLLGIELDFVEITTTSLDENGKRAVQYLGGQLIYAEDRTIIEVHNVNAPEGEESIIGILTAIRNSGAKLLSITSRTQSLEDLFVALSNKATTKVQRSAELVH